MVVSANVVTVQVSAPVVVALTSQDVQPELLSDFQHHLRPLVREAIRDSGFALVEVYGPGVQALTADGVFVVATEFLRVGYLIIEPGRRRIYQGVRTGTDFLFDLAAPACDSAMTTLDMRRCAGAEIAEATADLVFTASEGADGAFEGDFGQWREEWLDECRQEPDDYQGGSLEGFSVMLCLKTKITEREAQLRAEAVIPNGAP